MQQDPAATAGEAGAPEQPVDRPAPPLTEDAAAAAAAYADAPATGDAPLASAMLSTALSDDPAEMPMEFDADARSARRRARKVTIGGQVFYPAPKTVELMEAIAPIAADIGAAQRKAREHNDPEAAKRANELTLEQLSHFLVKQGAQPDDEDAHPKVPFLKARLEVEDATPLIAFLYGVVIGGPPAPEAPETDDNGADPQGDESPTKPASSEES